MANDIIKTIALNFIEDHYHGPEERKAEFLNAVVKMIDGEDYAHLLTTGWNWDIFLTKFAQLIWTNPAQMQTFIKHTTTKHFMPELREKAEFLIDAGFLPTFQLPMGNFRKILGYLHADTFIRLMINMPDHAFLVVNRRYVIHQNTVEKYENSVCIYSHADEDTPYQQVGSNAVEMLGQIYCDYNKYLQKKLNDSYFNVAYITTAEGCLYADLYNALTEATPIVADTAEPEDENAATYITTLFEKFTAMRESCITGVDIVNISMDYMNFHQTDELHDQTTANMTDLDELIIASGLFVSASH